MIPKTSSITAPPSIVVPTSESKTFRSSNVLTVTPTEVATNINPIMALSFVEKPKNKAAPIPNINGRITPPIATKDDDFPIFFNFGKLVCNPDIKSMNSIPISASSVNSLEVKSN